MKLGVKMTAERRGWLEQCGDILMALRDAPQNQTNIMSKANLKIRVLKTRLNRMQHEKLIYFEPNSLERPDAKRSSAMRLGISKGVWGLTKEGRDCVEAYIQFKNAFGETHL